MYLTWNFYVASSNFAYNLGLNTFFPPRVWELYFFPLRVWKVTKLVHEVLKIDQISPSVSWPLVDLTDWHVDQLKIDMCHLIKFFFKFQKKKKKKRKEKAGGGFGHPLGSMGVAEPPLGAQRGGYDHPQLFLSFFFFFEI